LIAEKQIKSTAKVQTMPKGTQIKFFVPDEWHELLVRDAASHHTTLSGYLRSHLPGIPEVSSTSMVPKNFQLAESVAILTALRQELKAIGNNVNQSAMVLNSHAKFNGQLPTQLDLREEYDVLSKAIDRLSREIRSINQGLIGE
jgi:hypothetical protein